MNTLQRLRHFIQPFDKRYEDLSKGNLALNVLRDFTAGLVVAMVAIPLAMGFAMASGLRPEQGIVGGAVAGAVGALFGGSKYQVYGPTAAYIPIIGAIMLRHDHRFLVLCSLIAGGVLMLAGIFRLGRFVKMVPHSIVVGFTIGIAFTIALSQGGEVFGLHARSGYGSLDKIRMLVSHFGQMHLWALVLAIGTLFLTKWLLRISVFLPGPLISLGVGVLVTQTVLRGHGITLVREKYGRIPGQSLILTPPAAIQWSGPFIGDLLYFSVAIVFVAAIESLLCSRMADRLAGNRGTPFDPDKELWGQGHVMAWVPLLNGFPHTGALARTATNIKLGAISPLAGIFKAILKLLLAFYLARYLELVPMPCIAGILLYVAMNMVKKEEVTEVTHQGRAHIYLMAYTAVAVVVTDFLRGVLSALFIYAVVTFIAKSVRGAKTQAESALALATAGHNADAGARAVLGHEQASARRREHDSASSKRQWLANIRRPAWMARTAYVHHQASVIGRVVMGEHVHVAAGASIRADEGSPFFIGSNTNLQDGVVIHALKEKYVMVGGEQWAVYIGKRVSVAHDALIHGPCFIGDDTFIGFKAVVHDAVVSEGCFVGIGAVVVGVEVPPERFVPPGSIIDTPAKAAALPPVTAQHKHFNEDVVDVNRGLADAYREYGHRTRQVTHEVDSWSPPARRAERF